MILWEVRLLVRQVAGSHQSEYHRQEHQPVEETEHDHKEEHLEEDHEGVVVRGGQEYHCQEGGETTVEHGWSNLKQRVLDPESYKVITSINLITIEL